MLILGRKHKLTKFERYSLNKKKIKTTTIRFTNRTAQEILKDLHYFVEIKKSTLIVINTKVKMDDEIIKYLTKLQFTQKISILTIEKCLEKYLHKCYIPDDDVQLNYLENIQPYTKFQYFQKRTIDYISVFILLILSLPLLLYSRKKIKKESQGSSLYKQIRVGKNGKKFKCNKFRSMHLGCDSNPYTTKNDKRIFEYGVFMRKTRIDELPQLLNVLKGDMHLVGPRAEWDILVEKYEKKIPYYNERHIVSPGITGWAQVNYPYGVNIEDTKQKLMYDLYYIKYWNIFLEIEVLWKTVLVVLGKKGV